MPLSLPETNIISSPPVQEAVRDHSALLYFDMEANRIHLLALNGISGEHIVSPIYKAGTLASQSTTANATMQRRDSISSLDTLVREKDEANATTAPHSGLRSTLSKIARQLSGARKEGKSIAGQVAVAGSSVHEHEPFQVYVVGDQVVYLGPGSSRRTWKKSEKESKGHESRPGET